MASKKTTTPYRQLYFGEKPVLIEKNWKKWLGNPIKLEEQLKDWFAENAKVMGENKLLKDKLKEKDQEITDLKNSFDTERLNWVNERHALRSQTDAANVSRDTAWEKLESSRKFAKETYVILGNYGTNPPLWNLSQLKWLLRKHDKPTSDKDYYTLYDLVKMSPKEFDKLKTELANSQKRCY